MKKTNSKRTIIIGSSIEHRKILTEIERLKKTNSDCLVISLNSSADRTLKNNSIPFVPSNKYEYLGSEQKPIRYAVNMWLSKWLLKPKTDNSDLTIFSNFQYDNIPWWWFIDRRTRNDLLEVFLLIKALKRVKDNTKTDEIIIYDSLNRLQYLTPQIFQNDAKIKVLKTGFVNQIFTKIKNYLKNILGSRFLLIKESFLAFMSKTFLKNSMKLNNNKDLVVTVTTRTQWRKIYDSSEKRFVLGDYYFHNIHEEFQNQNFEVIQLYKLRSYFDERKIVNKKKESLKYAKVAILDRQTHPKAKKKFKDEIKYFKKKYKVFKKKLLKKEDFIYEGVEFFPLIEDEIAWNFKIYIPLGLRWKYLLSSFIYNYQPTAIMYINELFTLGRSATLAAKETNIFSIALQHGFFTDFEFGYFESGQPQIHKFDKPISPLVPTLTLVFGPHYKKLLINANYSSNNIQITGNPVHDRSISFREHINREDVLKSLGLDTQKKTIAFGTQHLFYETGMRALRTITEFGEIFPNLQLIIKIHQNDNMDRYRIIKEESSISVRLIKDINIFKVIEACDIYTTQFSASVLDALILHKPIIIFNYFNAENPPLSPFIKANAVVEVTNKESAFNVLIKLLEDEQYQNKIAMNRNRILFDYVYKLDGNAAKNVVDAIKNYRSR